MDAFLVSTGIVGLAEIGDKTQLLAILLAARFRRPLPIVFGILVATVCNHGFAAAVGSLASELAGPGVMRWALGLGFLGMAAWAMVPDQADANELAANKLEVNGVPLARYGVFLTTVIAFFVAEMGDKSQAATLALAARYASMGAVVAGTSLGMMLANVPAAVFGGRFAQRVPLRLAHGLAALIFAALGVTTLLDAGEPLGF